MRFASVDIGSNAVRFLFCDVYHRNNNYIIKKTSLIRLPIRLGEDVFVSNRISQINIDKLIKSFTAFKNLCEVYDVINYRACATSAMRDSKNGKDVIKLIKKQTNIEIEIITGQQEAELIYETHIAEKIDEKGTFLFMDVGGGSTELTLFSDGTRVISESFQIGTIRLKNDLVKQKQWGELEAWIKKIKKKHSPSLLIATGGNINKIYKLCGLKDYKLLSFEQLNEMITFLNKYSIEERIEKLGLKPDRADVITHAGKIYKTALKHSNIKNIFVPKVGLADGIIQQLFEEHQAKNFSE